MIDFRYHLVSLFSVFLALAVGIVLGAGPLKAPIGKSLQSQVESLREDRDGLRTDLDKSRAETQNLNAFVEANAPEMLGSKLKDRTIAVVRAEDAADADVRGIEQQLKQAGAEILEGGSLTKTSFASTEEDSGLADELREHIDDIPSDPAKATVRALTDVWGGGKGDSALKEDDAQAVLKILRAHSRIDGGEPGKADAVVFIAGDTTAVAADSSDGKDDKPADPDVYLESVERIQSAVPTVVAGPLIKGGLIDQLRGGRGGTTVDGVETNAGAVITALAADDLIRGGKPAAYGFGPRADELYPGMKK